MVEPQSGFHNLQLTSSLLAALARAATINPPDSSRFHPPALTGRDVIGQAQTGTGKTAAFLLPFLNGWRDNNLPGPEAIILAPTRARRTGSGGSDQAHAEPPLPGGADLRRPTLSPAIGRR